MEKEEREGNGMMNTKVSRPQNISSIHWHSSRIPAAATDIADTDDDAAASDAAGVGY